MRRFIPTILLVVVCIGAFWYASSKDFFREKKDEPKALVALQQENVQSFSLHTADQQIEMNRKDNSWEMAKPAAVPISGSQVDSWLDSFGLVNQEKVVEENAADLAKYGLDQPAQVYEVTMKDGSKKGIQVGAALPIQGFSYAKTEDSPTVYQVSDQSLQLLAKTPVDFMDTSPFAFDNDKVQSVKLTWKGQSWTLSKTDKDKVTSEANWKLGDKELKGSDASSLLNELVFLHTTVLAKPAGEVPTAGGELKVELTLSDNGKETTDTYEGKLSQDQVWLAKQGGQWAYQLTAADIQKMADAYDAKLKEEAPTPTPAAK
ncbi:DUF4340 domain-containing protein [Paenibacillus hexagrammi]|uniref:DUF4340 domain-containing protein n=1 Tax=Paenibacillus hexagrammi TaxID=2908839 RepID=A0ABY3SGJ6_9BACL|nr:DUF4340 domain-containing protein [Paenibacillus sp. YPD9-1]UJF33153.1 DUF4340 domain-containing protein [Paenibacillus sp. YPD9-1]